MIKETNYFENGVILSCIFGIITFQ